MCNQFLIIVNERHLSQNQFSVVLGFYSTIIIFDLTICNCCVTIVYKHTPLIGNPPCFLITFYHSIFNNCYTVQNTYNPVTLIFILTYDTIVYINLCVPIVSITTTYIHCSTKLGFISTQFRVIQIYFTICTH